jgi:hypothetical protein
MFGEGRSVDSKPAWLTRLQAANRVFYLQQPQGFGVLALPLGVTVAGLPAGATPVSYLSGGTYYIPSMQAGATVYTTMQP